MTEHRRTDKKTTGVENDQTHGADRDPGEKTELQMTFLPKTAEARSELWTLLIAIPLSLIGTGFLFYLVDTGARLAS
jgi:hypothetical protein